MPARPIPILLAIAAALATLSALAHAVSSQPWPDWSPAVETFFAALIAAWVAAGVSSAAGKASAPTAQQRPPQPGTPAASAPKSAPAARERVRASDGPRSTPVPTRARPERNDPGATAIAGPRESGAIKWFSRQKGYGFIIRDTGGEIFVHLRSLRDRHDVPEDGARVEFSVTQHSKGDQAEDVVVIH